MKKEEMLEEMTTMLKALNKPLELSGLAAITLPDGNHKYKIIEQAYKWMKTIYGGPYKAWLKVWLEEPESVWVRRQALGGFREVKILKQLTYEVRLPLMRRSTKPQLLRRGYQRQHEQQAKNSKAGKTARD